MYNLVRHALEINQLKQDLFVYEGDHFTPFHINFDKLNLQKDDFHYMRRMKDVHLELLAQSKIPVYDQIWKVKKDNLEKNGIQVSQDEVLVNTGNIKEYLPVLDKQKTQQYIQQIYSQVMKEYKYVNDLSLSKINPKALVGITVKITYKTKNYLSAVWYQHRLNLPKNTKATSGEAFDFYQSQGYVIAYYNLLADGALGEKIQAYVSEVPFEDCSDGILEMEVLELIGYDQRKQQYFLKIKEILNESKFSYIYFLIDRKENTLVMPE